MKRSTKITNYTSFILINVTITILIFMLFNKLLETSSVTAVLLPYVYYTSYIYKNIFKFGIAYHNSIMALSNIHMDRLSKILLISSPSLILFPFILLYNNKDIYYYIIILYIISTVGTITLCIALTELKSVISVESIVLIISSPIVLLLLSFLEISELKLVNSYIILYLIVLITVISYITKFFKKVY